MTAAQDLLVPVRRFTARPGVLRLPESVILAGAGDADVLPLAQLAMDLDRLGIRSTVAVGEVPSAFVQIRRDPSVHGSEAYRLTVSPKGVEVHASADAGAYYAVQTLRDLLSASGRTLRACVIDDRPDFARRGVYLDCSRGKVPRLETLLALVEQLAHWKINELQLYVENVFTWRRHPEIGRGYSPFTPEELLAVQDRCRQHHVRLVGSLAGFGHMEKILALPEVPAPGRTGRLPRVPRRHDALPHRPRLDPPRDGTVRGVRAALRGRGLQRLPR